MGEKSKKKVSSVVLAKDQHGNPETYYHQDSGKTFYSSIITFDDNSKGTFSHEGEAQSHFVVGQEAEFEAENKGKWWKLRKPKTGYPGGGKGAWTPKTARESKQDAIGFTAKYICDLIAVDKIDVKDFAKYLKTFTAAINREIDNVQ